MVLPLSMVGYDPGGYSTSVLLQVSAEVRRGLLAAAKPSISFLIHSFELCWTAHSIQLVETGWIALIVVAVLVTGKSILLLEITTNEVAQSLAPITHSDVPWATSCWSARAQPCSKPGSQGHPSHAGITMGLQQAQCWLVHLGCTIHLHAGTWSLRVPWSLEKAFRNG